METATRSYTIQPQIFLLSKEACWSYNIRQPKKHHYNEKIAENSHDPKALFRIFNTLLRRNDPLPIPPTTCDKTLANDFNNFFDEKIDKIMSFLRPIETRLDASEYLETNFTTKQRINKFELTTTTAVPQLIKKSQAVN